MKKVKKVLSLALVIVSLCAIALPALAVGPINGSGTNATSWYPKNAGGDKTFFMVVDVTGAGSVKVQPQYRNDQTGVYTNTGTAGTIQAGFGNQRFTGSIPADANGVTYSYRLFFTGVGASNLNVNWTSRGSY